MAGAKSPVAGEAFPSLSKNYSKEKKEAGFSGRADLERTGSLKDSITFRQTSKGIEIGIFDDKENAGKADGHCNFSGDSPLPQRRFLPDEGQSFKSDIQREIERIVREKFVEDVDVKLRDLRGIDSREAFNEMLDEFFPELSRAEAIRAIISSEDMYAMFDEAGLLEYLKG